MENNPPTFWTFKLGSFLSSLTDPISTFEESAI
jgi:hypothetical protein